MNAIFEQAHQKLLETQDPELESFCDEMAQWIPITLDYTFTFLNGDTHPLSLTYAPNRVGTPAFISECKERLSELTGIAAETMGIHKQEDRLYCVVLEEVPPPPRWKHYSFSKTVRTEFSIPHNVDIGELDVFSDGDVDYQSVDFPVVHHHNGILHDVERFDFDGEIDGDYYTDRKCDEHEDVDGCEKMENWVFSECPQEEPSVSV